MNYHLIWRSVCELKDDIENKMGNWLKKQNKMIKNQKNILTKQKM